MVQPASKPGSPAPAAEHAAASDAAPAAAAPAPASGTGGGGDLPTAEQAAASGQNLVGHFFGGSAAAAASGAEAAAPAPSPESKAAAAPAAAEEAGAGAEQAGEEEGRYPVVHQVRQQYGSGTTRSIVVAAVRFVCRAEHLAVYR
jgi:hypothetical protein